VFQIQTIDIFTFTIYIYYSTIYCDQYLILYFLSTIHLLYPFYLCCSFFVFYYIFSILLEGGQYVLIICFAKTFLRSFHNNVIASMVLKLEYIDLIRLIVADTRYYRTAYIIIDGCTMNSDG